MRHEGQSYRERRPAPPLAGLVSAVWVQRVPAGAAPYVHRSIPNGSVELVCELGSVPRVIGPRTGPVVETLAPGAVAVGARFHPGAAVGLLGVPAGELVDVVAPADALWGAAGVRLGEVLAPRSPEAASAALEAELVARLPDLAEPDPLVAEVVRRLRPWQAGDVGSLPGALHFSERQLRRRCRQAVGLAPKVLHRTLRFQGFLALAQAEIALGRRPHEDGLAALAAEVGYADQSHLARECGRLTGQSPRDFLRQTEQQCGEGHDHAASYEPLLAARLARRRAARRA